MKLNEHIIAKAAGLFAGALLVPTASQAAQLAYEGFDYASGSGNLTGLNGGSGWGGTWRTVNNGSADVVIGSLAAGSNSPSGYDPRSIGNSSNLPNNRRIGRFLDTSASGPFGSRGYVDGSGRIGADGTTVYLSFIQQPNGITSYYEFEIHRGDLGDGGRIGGIGNDTNTNNVNLRAPGGTHTSLGAGDTGVNFYVLRIDFKAGNDDVYVYRNPTTATEPTPTLTRLAVADMSFDGFSFGAFNNGRTVAHDEIRLGQSWADVTVPPAAQPAITSQPRASTSYVGGSVVLTAAASGSPLPAYQWFKGVNPISGATKATLTLSNVQLADTADYHLTATNGSGTATTDAAHVTVLAAPPGLLAYEGFDYAAGTGNLPGKTGGFGWASAWAAVSGGGGNVIDGNLAAGTNAPNGYDAVSLGNSSLTTNGRREGRYLDTTPGGRLGGAGYVDGSGNIGADGKTIYLSFLQQPNGTSSFYELELHRGDLGDPGRIGGVGNDVASADVRLRTGGTQTLIGPGSTAVNFYVVRIDFKAGNDDVYVYQNPLSSTEPGVATLTKLATSDMSFNGMSFAAFNNGRTVKHDEIRLGQSWSDVVFGTSRRQLVWVGDGIFNNWDFSNNNWNAGSGPTAFVNGDPVTFDDSGSATPALNIAASVSTSSITFNNSFKNYTLGGAGSIGCSGGLLKSGSGSITLIGPATFGSAMVVNGGDLALNGITTVGGDLILNPGSGTVTLGGNNTFSGSLSAATGTQALSGANTFAGLVTLNSNLTISGPTNITGTGGTTLWIGNLTGANSSLTVETGGSLNITGVFNDSWVIGRDGGNGSMIQNGGIVTYNPSNRGEAIIGASASGGTTASYAMNGGTLEMSTKRLGLAIGPISSSLTQTGGNINVRQLDLGANLATGTGVYSMTGGVLTVGTGGITSFSGLYSIELGGGIVAAAADWASSLSMTLTGSTTFDTAGHNIRLSGPITGAGGLIKNGTGILTTTGFNEYSGPTLVNAGILAGYGNSNASPLTVANGATVAPGDTAIGSFSCGSAAFASGSTLALKIDSTSGQSDGLVSLGPIGVTGAYVSFTSIGSGVIPVGTTLVILEGASITGTFAGLAQNSEFTVGGNTYQIHYGSTQVDLTLTRSDPYIGWAAAKGLDGSPGKETAFNADPEKDGISNGLEWILGGNPLAPDAASLVVATSSASDGLTLTFNREEGSIGSATLFVQRDSDLDGTWTDIPITQAGGSYPTGVTVTVNESSTPDAVTVHIPAVNSSGGKLFGRIRASMP
ncbi:MAG: immunoglobulin domain-containing protein [Luteolibacter sp.]|uniref:beta strand repeat-containing protein n=1 Tax=Luteolibacter sp. TaxID=1962973 RepID=UPI003264CA69